MAKLLTPTQRVVRNLRDHRVKVLTRDQWGSEPSGWPWPLAPNVADVYAWRRRHKRHDRFPSELLVQHITVTPLSGDFRRDLRAVERIGFGRFGSGFSYNAAVDMRTGVLGIGQPLDAAGTHTVNNKEVPGYPVPPSSLNYSGLAIACLGMPDYDLSDEAERTIAKWIAALVEEKILAPGFEYRPHSYFAHKDCPSDATRDRMDEIRARARRMLGRRQKGKRG